MHNSTKPTIDMLNGPMLKKIVMFAIPLALGSILQQLFNAVDSAVVGRFAGSNDLAAVGANASVVSLMINIFLGFAIGTNVVIATYIGQGNMERIRKTTHTAIPIAFFCGLVMAVLSQFLARPILIWMGAPEEILELAIVYLRIYGIGMPFIMLHNVGSAIIRSTGDTKRPLLFLTIAGVVNACLNVFLVVRFHMGVAGVAIATSFSNFVCAALVIGTLCRETSSIHVDLRRLYIDPKEFRSIFRIGLPSSVQGSVFPLANVVIQSGVNSYGALSVAGSAVALNFEYMTYFAVNGFVQAAVTFTGQNYGARKLDRCKRIFWLCMISGIVGDLGVACLAFLGKTQIISLFTTDPAVFPEVYLRMTHVLIFHWMIATYEVAAGCMRGMGKANVPAILTIFGTCFFRLFYVFTEERFFHRLDYLYLVYPVSWVLTGIIVVVAFFIVFGRELRKIES